MIIISNNKAKNLNLFGDSYIDIKNLIEIRI